MEWKADPLNQQKPCMKEGFHLPSLQSHLALVSATWGAAPGSLFTSVFGHRCLGALYQVTLLSFPSPLDFMQWAKLPGARIGEHGARGHTVMCWPTCLSVRWHSAAVFVVVLTICPKTTHERGFPQLPHRGQEQWDACLRHRRRILRGTNGSVSCTVIKEKILKYSLYILTTPYQHLSFGIWQNKAFYIEINKA